MADFQPPPTYALPIVVDEKTGKATFSPIWLKWFLDLVGVVNALGGSSGSGINHNALANIQGGQANQYYHLTAAQQALAAIILVTGLRPPDEDGSAQVVTRIFGGNGAPSNANGSNGDFYFRGDGAAGTLIYHKAAGAWTAFA